MFPSVGLFAKIECPFRDKCGRGSLCLFDHRPPAANANAKRTAAVSVRQVAAVPAVRKPTAVTQPAQMVSTPPTAPIRSTPPPAPVPSMAPSPPPPAPTPTPTPAPAPSADWRHLTINYDASGPGYDARTEQQAVVPQLKAAVGERVGYARRQRSVEMLFEHYMQLMDAATVAAAPWVAAEQAILDEAAVYNGSGAGTYHSKLLARMRELKKQQ
ncbi:hypothetical protein H4R99_006161 [Coemansia sp. RSA 1722]|nr:hypothetical protein IWW45_006313 [Coemansia sp. RSA 485]KAJ2593234.1 hypothetical protein H4R99_006161 [Coemansia sp. RSA 1722]